MHQVAFWADSGPGVGLGHVARSCAIALELKRLGAEPAMVVPEARGADYVRTSGLQPIVSSGFAGFAGEAARPSAAVVDSYRLDAADVSALRARGIRVAALDDTATDVLPADLVINGAPGAERLPYERRPGVEYVLGPQYFPLRETFRSWPEKAITADVSRVLVTVGGEDVHNLLAGLMSACEAVFTGAVVTGVCGTRRAAPDAQPAKTILYAPPDYVDLVRRADVVLCGAGQSLIEAAATGTPAAALLLGADQRPQLTAIAAAGACVEAGSWEMTPAEREGCVRLALERLRPAAARSEMSRRGRSLVDGGGAMRVAAEILRLAQQAPVNSDGFVH
jgi:UDP-2,4-diacetamido-2,4,6-trideoxy-beta-L-altropyranose hydrolase